MIYCKDPLPGKNLFDPQDYFYQFMQTTTVFILNRNSDSVVK